ncbi:MAG TPA: universal stress protein [Geminicoccaceae bacterium]|nr:universal stress protein [Geminicoccaceae bacterium]
MAYKNLLVQVDDTRGCARRIEFAVALAVSHEAHLTGVYIISEPSPSSFVGIPVELLTDLQQKARERADFALGRFADVAKRNQIAFETRFDRVLYTEVADALATNARYADLVILGQHDPDDPAAGPRYLQEEVILGSGRPALIVPYIGPAATFGERVMIAWDASREAARAVNDALPLLERAKAAGVVTVNPGDKPFGHGEEPGADIGLHLARHGIKVEVQRVESRDLDTANAILSHVANEGADVLVMGAYGHSRLREVVLGGVTRTILAEMTVPVLMSH